MSENTTAEAPKAKKAPIVYTDVTMPDGTLVKFPGDQKVKKSVVFNDGFAVGVRFDFRNAQFRELHFSALGPKDAAYATAHGLLQKVGDEWSGTKEIEDIVLTCDEIISRLTKPGDENWSAEREAGDSMAGASIVIQALVETSGKTVDEVKKYLDGRLEAAKAKGEKLTRQALYASFRNPTSKVGQAIRRLEDAKAAKSAAVDADAELAALTGA